MNIYGYWQYNDSIGLACGIDKYDLVYVFKVKNNMVQAINEKGKIISFHKTNITKDWFNRPSHEYHKKCSAGTKSSHFNRTGLMADRHKNDCHKCQMYKLKKTVKRFQIRSKEVA